MSFGVRKKGPSGSIWVACAFSAASRVSKYSPTGTRVVISRCGQFSRSFSSSQYGDSRPRSSISWCSASMRASDQATS